MGCGAPREELLQQQRSNPPLALMFAMAEDTAKRLAVPNNGGYFIVELDEIIAGEVDEEDPIFAQARDGYAGILSREFGDQLRVAIRDEVGIEQNPEAVDAVRRELTGATR